MGWGPYISNLLNYVGFSVSEEFDLFCHLSDYQTQRGYGWLLLDVIDELREEGQSVDPLADYHDQAADPVS